MVKWAFATIIGIFIGIGTYLYLHLGFSEDVLVGESTRTELILLGQEHRGAYHKIGEKIMQVENLADLLKIPCERSFGQYLDNPQIVDEDRLRSFAGCITDQIPENLQAPFEVRTFPEGRFVTAEFSGSPAIGPMKVYPKLQDYFIEKGLQSDGQSLEVYTIEGDSVRTEYLMRILE